MYIEGENTSKGEKRMNDAEIAAQLAEIDSRSESSTKRVDRLMGRIFL